MKFSILLPTLGRPEGLKRAVDSIFATAEGEVEVLIGCDTDEWDDVRAAYGDICTVSVYANGSGSSRKTFEMARGCTGDAMRIGSNDEEWITPGWDRLLFERWEEDPFLCLYTNDRPGKNTGGRAPCITREWYDVAGYYPSHFHHWHADTWVTEIAERVGRLRHVPEVSIVHHHPKSRLGTGKMDDVYAKRGPKQQELYNSLSGERRLIAGKLADAVSARA